MHTMQRPEISLVQRLLPGFELQTSNVPKRQMKMPANRCTQANRLPVNRSIGFQRPTQQIGTPAKQCTGDRRPATGESPYQIPTFNTTDRYTGEAAYRRPASRRIRFQRSTQQIGTPANWRTGDRRPASRRIRFQRSTQQIGTPANWRTDVSAPRSPTGCRDWR